MVEVTHTGKIDPSGVLVELVYDPARLGKDQVASAYLYSSRKKRWVYIGGEMGVISRTVSFTLPRPGKFSVLARPLVPVFTDMSDHWAEPAVRRLAGDAVVTGYPDGSFRPEKEMTRAEMVLLLTRLLDLAPPAGYEPGFKDAADIQVWAREAVAAAAWAGLIKGYPEPDGGFTFQPASPVTRAEVVELAARAMVWELGQEAGVSAGAGAAELAAIRLADIDEVPAWNREALGIAVARGVVEGYPDGTFRPARRVTRAEGAKVILRLLDTLY